MPGFRTIRDRFIDALREGRYEHEPRDALAEKNLLAVGELGPEDVVQMLRRCSGRGHRAAPHHFDRSVVVHEFQSSVGGRRWYVKGYLLEDSVVFISVHPSG